eukprot:3558111-Rhodomonas_salina.3
MAPASAEPTILEPERMGAGVKIPLSSFRIDLHTHVCLAPGTGIRDSAVAFGFLHMFEEGGRDGESNAGAAVKRVSFGGGGERLDSSHGRKKWSPLKDPHHLLGTSPPKQQADPNQSEETQDASPAWSAEKETSRVSSERDVTRDELRLEELEQENLNLKFRLAQLEDLLEAIKSKGRNADGSEETEAALRAQCLALNTQVGENKREVAYLKKEIQRLEDLLEDAETTRIEFKHTQVTLTKQLQAARSLIEKFCNFRGELQLTLHAFISAIQFEEQPLSDNHEADHDNEYLVRAVKELLSLYDQASEKANFLDNELEAAARQIAGLEDELDKRDSNLSELEHSLATALKALENNKEHALRQARLELAELARQNWSFDTCNEVSQSARSDALMADMYSMHTAEAASPARFQELALHQGTRGPGSTPYSVAAARDLVGSVERFVGEMAGNASSAPSSAHLPGRCAAERERNARECSAHLPTHAEFRPCEEMVARQDEADMASSHLPAHAELSAGFASQGQHGVDLGRGAGPGGRGFESGGSGASEGYHADHG